MKIRSVFGIGKLGPGIGKSELGITKVGYRPSGLSPNNLGKRVKNNKETIKKEPPIRAIGESPWHLICSS